MQKSLRRIVSATLICSLLANPSLSVIASTNTFPTCRQVLNPLYAQANRLDEDALALDPVAVGRFQFKPFASLWTLLKEYSGIEQLLHNLMGHRVLITPEGIPIDPGPLFFMGKESEGSASPAGNSENKGGSSNAAESELVAEFRRLADIAGTRGIKLGADAIDAIHLLGSRTKHHAHVRGRVAEIVSNANEVFKIPYDPPESADKEHNPPMERREILNHQEMIGQSVQSIEVLLVVIAKKLVRMRDKDCDLQTRAYLKRELEEIYSPLAYRLGMRAVSARLRQEAFQYGDPSEYERIVSILKRILRMDRQKAVSYQKELRTKIKSALEKAGINAQVFGDPKGPDSIERKLEDKAEDYPNVTSIGDKLRLTIILENKRQLGSAAGVVSQFFDRAVRGKQTELKRLARYNAFHITLIRLVKGRPQRHEVQFFESEADYYLYKYGFPDAHWAYILLKNGKRHQHQLRNFQEIEVCEDDPFGNLERFKTSVNHWTYFFVPRMERNATRLLTMRIPRVVNENGVTVKGNIADFIALSGQALSNFSSATTYQPIIDADLPWETNWKKTEFKMESEPPAYLYSIIKNGWAVRLVQGQGHSPSSNVTHTAAALKTIVELSAMQTGTQIKGRRSPEPKKGPSITGGSVLKRHLEKLLNPSKDQKRYKVVINKVFITSVLEIIAPYLGYLDPKPLLDLLVQKQLPSDFLVPLINQMVQATVEHGRDMLSKHSDYNLIQRDAWGTAALNFGFQDRDHLWLAIGLRLITVKEAIGMALKITLLEESDALEALKHIGMLFTTEPKPSEVVAAATGVTEKKPDNVAVDIEDTGDSYIILLLVYRDQPGILGAVTRPLKEQRAFLSGGDAERFKDGMMIHLAIDKNKSPQLDLKQLKEALENPFIERRGSETPTKRNPLTIHFSLLDEHGAFNTLSEALGISDINVESFRNIPTAEVGQVWFDMDVSIPDTPDKTPNEILKEIFGQIMAEDARQHLITNLEIVKDIDEPTAGEFLTRIHWEESQIEAAGWEHKPLIFLRGLIENLTKLGQSIFRTRRAPGLPADRAWNQEDVAKYEKAIDLTKRLHENEVRRSKGHPPYVIHPLSVAALLIQWGVRDEAVLIAALGHDWFEHFDYKIDQIMKDIKSEFPEMHNRITHDIGYVTYYKMKDSATQYIRNLTARGQVDLLALKLADMWDNLRTVFDVKDDPAFPKEQIAKRMRYGLPIVSWETYLKNNVYINSRHDFLMMLIEQSEKLSDEDFYRTYYEKGEDTAAVNQEVIKTIEIFLKWAQNESNAECLPMELGAERVDNFFAKLYNLAERLKRNSGGGTGGDGSGKITIDRDDTSTFHPRTSWPDRRYFPRFLQRSA